MAQRSEYYSRQTLDSVDIINTSHCEAARREAIETIVSSQEKDKARLLIELFQYANWRQTQGALLQAIGASRELRGVEFLIRFIRQSQDLPLVSLATIGLGLSQTSLAGEFLSSIMRKKDSRLRLEALQGLALMPHFHCDEEISQIINDEHAQDNLKTYAVIAAGRRGAKQALPAILNTLNAEDVTLQQAALLASGHLLNTVENLDIVANIPANVILDEIRHYVGDRIYQRKQTNIEQLILTSIELQDEELKARFRLLREQAPEKVRQTLERLEDTVAININCLIRAAAHTKNFTERDIHFLIDNEEKLDFSEAAVLARLCINHKGPQFLNQLPPHNACTLLKHASVNDILAFSDRYFDPEKDARLAIEFINAVVAQSYMHWTRDPSHILFFKAQLRVTQKKPIVHRLLRALAQLGCTDSDYLDKLSADLSVADCETSAAYCLSLLPSFYSAPLLLAHLEKSYALGRPVEAVIERISLLGKVEGLNELPPLDEHTQTRCALPLLQILSLNAVPGFDGFLEAQLSFGNHTQQMLALSAIALNGKAWHCDILFSFMLRENTALRIRSVYGICLRGTADQHRHLLNWFVEQAFESEFAILIFNKIRPEQDGDYHEFLHTLGKLIHERRGPFVDDDILASALSLYDSIVLTQQPTDYSTPELSVNRHEQDSFLAKDILAYADFSETIKTVLRNAELTWRHTELFNKVVDKSTMLVQYSKSTDLLLQQKIGLPYFQNANEAFLSSLQTRVMELGLNTANFGQAKMIRFLNLEGFFTTREFPAHKLKMLSGAIMSGKILDDRFRAIDGLRAWSLILLLFARTFTIDNTLYTPLIPMKNSTEDKINSIVKLMNKFQDLRNSAAHHGVLVEPELLAEIRSESFALLNALGDVLA